jgi:hypothetical protein
MTVVRQLRLRFVACRGDDEADPHTHRRVLSPCTDTEGSRSERSEESEDPPQADRRSTRVRIAKRYGDAGETARARGWTTFLEPKIPSAPRSRRESIRSELPNPRSEATSTPLERRTTIRARKMHQSPASLPRAGLCEWSRRESNPSPPDGLDLPMIFLSNNLRL